MATYDRTIRIPLDKAKDLQLLCADDNLKSGPWMAKQILDAIKARSKELVKLRRKAGKN